MLITRAGWHALLRGVVTSDEHVVGVLWQSYGGVVFVIDGLIRIVPDGCSSS